MSAVTANASPRIVLVTMGPGKSLVTRLGHAALCIVEENDLDPRCVNYGAVAARNGIANDIVLGRARFQARVESYSVMIGHYMEENRHVYAQDLPLSEHETDVLMKRLAFDSLPENREYVYNPLTNNCATRIRDVLNEATGGGFASTKNIVNQKTYRTMSQALFVDRPILLLGFHLIPGTQLDTPLSNWQAMFIPSELRRMAEKRFGATIRVLHLGVSRDGHGRTNRQNLWLYVVGVSLLFTGLVSILFWFGGRLWLLSMTLLGGFLCAAAAIPWGLLVFSGLPQIQIDIILLIVSPTDLWIVMMPWIAIKKPKALLWLRSYILLRLIVLLIIGSACVAGAVASTRTPFVLFGLLMLTAGLWGIKVDRNVNRQNLKSLLK